MEEYKEKHPDGIMYTNSVSGTGNLKKTIKSHCVRSIKLAKKWRLIGWRYFNLCRHSYGKSKPAYLFVAVLPASNYPFVYAYGNTKNTNWIDGMSGLMSILVVFLNSQYQTTQNSCHQT